MQIMMVNVIISLLHMDDLSLNLAHCASPGSYSESNYTCASEQTDLTREEGNKLVVSFMGKLLDILQHCLPSTITELDQSLSDGVRRGRRRALEWRASIAKQFIEEWEWRLSILQRLLPLSERQWRWKEALTVLHAAPSELLNLWVLQAFSSLGIYTMINRFLCMNCFLVIGYRSLVCKWYGSLPYKKMVVYNDYNL